MTSSRHAGARRARRLWLNIHLWLGLTLGVLGVLIGVTGSILIYDTAIDARLNPGRYAVSGNAVGRSFQDYLADAQPALPAGGRATAVRLPTEDGSPVMVLARAQGERPGFQRIYLDPPTGRVLDVSADGGFVGVVHSLHENLTLREYMGREIVGLVGFGMLISSLSGIYLWWPTGALRLGLRGLLGFRPGLPLTRNLHYFFGFYGCVFLALLSFSGIWIAYPEGGRSVAGWFGPLSPSLRQAPGRQEAAQNAGAGNARDKEAGKVRGAQDGGNKEAAGRDSGRGADSKPRITADEAAARAQALYPHARLAGVTLPSGAGGTYRVGLNDPADSVAQPGGNIVVMVDRSGEITRRADRASRTAGDQFIAMQRPLHNGELLGPLGKAIYFITGFLPALFVFTGSLMWMRQRKGKSYTRVLQTA